MSLRMCWCVCTYGRPELLARVIHAFERQTYANRYMIILDDGHQFTAQTGDRWELISAGTRMPTLGVKRNAIATFAALCGEEALCPVDDDDLPLPWHTEACAAAIEKAEWCRPSVILANYAHGAALPEGTFQPTYTGHRMDHSKERMYHPSWAIRTDTFWRMGGYPTAHSGNEDKALMLKMEAEGVTQCDPCEIGFRPSYCYFSSKGNISGYLSLDCPTGANAWAACERKLEPAELKPWQPTWDYGNPTILPGILPRPF